MLRSSVSCAFIQLVSLVCAKCVTNNNAFYLQNIILAGHLALVVSNCNLIFPGALVKNVAYGVL